MVKEKEGYSSMRDAVPHRERHAKKVVVVGWCGDIQDLVDSLNMFAPGKTIVTVLCDCCPEVSLGLVRTRKKTKDKTRKETKRKERKAEKKKKSGLCMLDQLDLSTPHPAV